MTDAGPSSAPTVAVIDIGVTHAKLLLIDQVGRVIHRQQTDNPPQPSPPYLHIDTERLWRWLLESLAAAAKIAVIDALVPCAHGSAAALLDGDRLALPVMHYEAQPPPAVVDAYAAVTPPFGEVLAPVNPGGLTLARQLLWQQLAFPDAFARVDRILTYPQYWAWRLCGQAAVEVTSLGAQTHLWAPQQRQYSSLVERQGWGPLFAPLCPAWECLGRLDPALARQTGLPADTQVICGVHDSNANYLRYLAAGLDDFSLMSTGTWIINFNRAFQPAKLVAAYDTNTNSDIHGRAVCCSRFMGGREYALLGGRADIDRQAVENALTRVLQRQLFALPSFTDSGGPFPGSGGTGRIVLDGRAADPADAAERCALATLYCALMAAASLAHIGAPHGQLIIDGAFANNNLFCRLIAALHPQHGVAVADQADGTALGAAILARQSDRPLSGGDELSLRSVEPLQQPELINYSRHWNQLAEQRLPLGDARN